MEAEKAAEAEKARKIAISVADIKNMDKIGEKAEIEALPEGEIAVILVCIALI